MISLVSLIDRKQINILMNIFQKLQIKVINFLDTTTSYFFYMKNKKITKNNVALIDFGFNHINIIMVKNKQISFIKTIPIGCKLISEDLVKMLNISFDFAEKLKQKGIQFIIEPYIRFEGEGGEQATLFFLDPKTIHWVFWNITKVMLQNLFHRQINLMFPIKYRFHIRSGS